jgi:hypothetical protein
MCREKLKTEMLRNSTDPIWKFSETVISIADETIPKTYFHRDHHGLSMRNLEEEMDQ